MSVIRRLGKLLSRPMEICFNKKIIHQCVSHKRIWTASKKLTAVNKNQHDFYQTNLLKHLKGLCKEYTKTVSEQNPYIHCRKKITLICVASPAFFYVHYCTYQYFKNLKSQAFCSELDNSISIIKPPSLPQHKEVLLLIENIFLTVNAMFRLFFRAIRLNLTFLPVLFLYPFTLLSDRFRQTWWNIFLLAVEMSGPAFIKFGQWASTRRDLFSAEFCDKFSILHDHACTHSWEHTVMKMKQAYGKNWRNIFVIFENKGEPIGSGCIAQVYKAYINIDKLPKAFRKKLLEDRLMEENLEEQMAVGEGIDISYREDFEDDFIFDDEDSLFIPNEPTSNDIPYQLDVNQLLPVAVKVLHPNVHEIFYQDLTLMKVMSRVLQTIVPSLRWISLVECVDEFAVSMKKQLNMINEAKCMDMFFKNFSQNISVRIPQPIWPLVRKDVLVETFEEGEPISTFLKEDEDHPAVLRQKLAELGVDALLQMVFVNNFVHGDLHPGNILVQRCDDCTKTEEKVILLDILDTVVTSVVETPSPVRLVFLDCGITASLSPSDLLKFTEVFTAVVKGEGETVAELFLRKTSEMYCEDEKLFTKDMAQVVNKARCATIKLSKINVAELLSEVFGVLAKHHVKMESNFAMVIFAIAVLEGLGRSLDPNIDILEKAKPFLLQRTLFS